MTLDNLQYALYLNNRILLDRIKALKNALDDIVSTDIEDLKQLIDNINTTEITNLKNLINDLDTDLSNHVNDTVVHVTQDDKDLWNATLQNAKDYAKKLFDGVTSFTIEIVDELPTEDIKPMTIYFIRNGRENEGDYYEEHMYINDKWEIIGSTFVNLSPYLLKEDFEKYQQEITDKFAKYNTSDEITNILKDYLLTSDFNNAIKNYVSNQTFNDTIKKYTTTETLQKLLEEYAKTEDIHTHENKTIIDKLSESADGNLLFNGQEIKDGSDITISEEDNNAIQQKDDGIFVEDKTEQIDNIQTQVNRVSIAQKTVNTELDFICLTIDEKHADEVLSDLGQKVPFDKILYSNNMTLNEDLTISLKAGHTYEIITEFWTGNSPNTGIILVTKDITNDILLSKLCKYNGTVSTNGINNTAFKNIYNSDGHSIYKPKTDCNIAVLVGDKSLGIKFATDPTNLTLSKLIIKEISHSIIIDPLEHINNSQGLEDTPVGHIMSHMGNAVPSHYLICDGNTYNIADYPYLAEHFKTEFGSYNYFGGNGTTTFAVPDLRGEFLRGTGTATRNTGSGANTGIHQDGTEIPYFWSLGTNDGGNLLVGAGNGVNSVTIKNLDKNNIGNGNKYIRSNIIVNDTIEFTQTYTSRPTNTSVLYCIKYEPTYYMTVGEYTVQGFEDYSEEEKIIGRWIDGRPIYRSIIITNLPSTTTDGADSYVDYPFDANIKLVTNIKATYTDNNVNCWTDSYNQGTANIHLYCSLYYNLLGKFIRINNSTVNWNNALAYIVIEYTKYTDEENSFTPDMLSTIVMSGNKQEDLTEEELNNLITDTINLLNE